MRYSTDISNDEAALTNPLLSKPRSVLKEYRLITETTMLISEAMNMIRLRSLEEARTIRADQTILDQAS